MSYYTIMCVTKRHSGRPVDTIRKCSRPCCAADYHLEGTTTCQECKEVDDFVERHGSGIAFLHRLAATEDYLEAKAHALLGIGAESSAKLYSILQQRLGPHVGSMPVRALLTRRFCYTFVISISQGPYKSSWW